MQTANPSGAAAPGGMHWHDPGSPGHEHLPNDGHQHESTGTSAKRLLLVLGITLAFLGIQFAGALLTGSLALLADSGHLLSDAVALALALGAAWLAKRPASLQRTFGFRRAEVLAGLINGVTLFIIAIGIAYEATQRFGNPPEVQSVPMLVIAFAGLAANVIALRLLNGGHSLNERGAYLHVLGDLLGSVGVIVAGLLILFFGWYIADPILSILISVLVLGSAFRLVRDAVNVLLLAAPTALDMKQVQSAMLAEPGVVAVHDLHVWTVNSGFVSLSSHVTVAPTIETCDAIEGLTRMLRDKFQIEHATLQVEHQEYGLHPDCEPCLDGTPASG